ncbi:hypothetical protein TrRE_jg6369 [Triparma retinervis]|uniref:Uncharacterized protein n=1 Tax=Triparma retinervis TaxID=2557542 RepID=A0A9W7A7G9_9STRA|nr:hypothetical protein TrRE_jg6369 [Triparma retinervis]
MKHKFLGGVQLENGDIFAIPSHSDTALCISPSTSKITRFGGPFNPDYKFKWLRAISTPSSSHIIGIPCWSNSILKICTSTKTASTFGSASLSAACPPPIDRWKWHGGHSAGPSGYMYAVPANAPRVLKIHPHLETASCIGPTFDGRQKWYGGIKSLGGHIYCVPYGWDRVLKIDPFADDAFEIGPSLNPVSEKGTLGYGWHGGVYSSAHDAVYAFPSHATGVLKIDCGTDEVSVVGEGSLPDTEYKWLGGGADGGGAIYGVPSDADEVLMIEPGDDRVTMIRTDVLGGGKKNKFQGAVLGGDGGVYAIPSDEGFVMKIERGEGGEVKISKIEGLSRPGTKDKFQGAGVAEGKIYLIPENYHTPCVIHLEEGRIEELF